MMIWRVVDSLFAWMIGRLRPEELPKAATKSTEAEDWDQRFWQVILNGWFTPYDQEIDR